MDREKCIGCVTLTYQSGRQNAFSNCQGTFMDVDQLGMLKNKQNYIYEHFEWLQLDLNARNQCSRLISTLTLKSYYETCLC